MPKEDISIELQERLQSLQDHLAAIPSIETEESNALKASLLVDLGKAETEAGNFEAASKHLQEGLALQIDNSLEKASNHTELSNAYIGLAQLKEAEQEIDNAIQIYLLKQEKKGLNKANRQLALIYAQQDRGKDANQLIQKSIEELTIIEEWEEVGRFYGFAGELASMQQNYQSAFEHFRNGLKALKKTEGNHERMGNYYESLARLLMHFQKTEEAAHSFEEGAAQFQLAGKPLLQGGLLALAAKVWEGNGKYLQAIPYLERASQAFQQSEDDSATMQTADAHYQAGYLYGQEKQWEDAILQYQSALPFAQKMKDEMLIASIEDSIEQCQEKLASKKSSKSKEKGAKKGFFGKLKDMFG